MPSKDGSIAIWASLLALAAPLAGCQRLAGIDHKRLSAPAVQDTENATDCPLFGSGAARLRLADAIPGSEVLDLCVRPSGGRYPERPRFESAGESCGSGISYRDYTVGLGMDVGKFDFKLVRSGGACSDAGIEVTGVSLDEDESLTLLAYGPSVEEGALSTFEDAPPQSLDIPVRFVHSLNGVGKLDAGIARDQTIPTELVAKLFGGVEFGHVAARSQGDTNLSIDDIDDRGYIHYGGGTTQPGALLLGISQSSDPGAVLAAQRLDLVVGHAYTAFALGDLDSTRPPQIWVCDENESNGVFLSCGSPVAIQVEAFNSNLTDLFTDYIQERTDPAISAILKEPTDVLCVTEMFPPTVTAKLKNASSDIFKYRKFSDDVPAEATFGDLTDQRGNLPEYPPVACPDDLGTEMDGFLSCIESLDCVAPDSSSGEHHFLGTGIEASSCIFQCTSEGYPLLARGTAEAYQCYMCAIAHLSGYESVEATRTACTESSDHPDHMTFGGRTGLAVLSRYPLGDPELLLLPSTNWQRAAMRVPVTLPNGAVMDFWCGQLRYPNTEDYLPYGGPYGMGLLKGEGSAEEQRLEIERLIDQVDLQADESGSATVVALGTYCGPEVLSDDGNDILVAGLLPQNYQLMSGHWPELLAHDYETACTYCDQSSNPLNSGGVDSRFWSTHLFGRNIDEKSVLSTERTFMDPVVTIKMPGQEPFDAPASQNFGLRSSVRVTQ